MSSRTTAHPISKEDFDKILGQARKDLEKQWKSRKKVYTPTGNKIQEYIIAMCLGFGAGMRISEIYGLFKKQVYTYHKKGESGPTTRVIESSIPKLEYEAFEDKFIYLVKRKKGKSGRVPIPTKLFRRAGINRELLKKVLPLKTSYRSCENYFTALCKSVLHKHSTFHQLRHGFCTHALESGMDIHEVQLFAGHSRIDTTGKYLHANPLKALGKYEESF